MKNKNGNFIGSTPLEHAIILTLGLLAIAAFWVSVGYGAYLFFSPSSEPIEQPKQDTTANTKPPIAFIKQDTIVFDLERIGELDKVDTLILEGIEALEERLNNELEIK